MTGRSAHARAAHQNYVHEVARPENPTFPFVQSRWKAASIGSSIGCLDINRGTVRFWGRLEPDPKTGFGYAGQTYPFSPDPLVLPVSEYDGLLVSLFPSDLPPYTTSLRRHSDETEVKHRDPTPRRLTIVLETEDSCFTKDGRKQVATQWACTFGTSDIWERDLDKKPLHATDEACSVRLAFASFLPITCEGAAADAPPKPLRPEHITSVSFVCRSVGFGDQEGAFEFIIAGLEGSPLPSPSAEDAKGGRPSAGSRPLRDSSTGESWRLWLLRLFKILVGKGDKQARRARS